MDGKQATASKELCVRDVCDMDQAATKVTRRRHDVAGRGAAWRSGGRACDDAGNAFNRKITFSHTTAYARYGVMAGARGGKKTRAHKTPTGGGTTGGRLLARRKTGIQHRAAARGARDAIAHRCSNSVFSCMPLLLPLLSRRFHHA